MSAAVSVIHFFDALWWSEAATTTVGYKDIYPITAAGSRDVLPRLQPSTRLLRPMPPLVPDEQADFPLYLSP